MEVQFFASWIVKRLWSLRFSSSLVAVSTGYSSEGCLAEGLYLRSRSCTVWLVRLYALVQVVMLEGSSLAPSLGSDQGISPCPREVRFDLWQTITAMTCVMTHHVSFRSNIIKSFEWLLL